MVREGRVFISVATDPDFASNYYVTAYEVGAVVASGSSGTTATVDTGHGFAANDKFIVFRNGEYVANSYNTVTVAGASSLTITAFALSVGDILVNLAQDTGVSSPNYNGNGLAVYSDMDYGSQLTNNTLQTDANGRYRYFYNSIPIWELVRSALTVPFAIYLDTGVSGIAGPASSTDNAVVRWDGTNGLTTQNSVVTIGDTGATTGISTLNVSGALTAQAAVTVGTTLGVTGTSTLAAVNASGTVAAAGAATVGTTLTVTGTLTASAAASVGTTLTVTGATSLAAVTASGNATVSGNLLRSVAAAVTAAASPNNTQVGGTALTKDINNVSVCATAGNSVVMPSAAAGMLVSVFNNGVASCAIWPASGDNLGLGANIQNTLAAATNVTYCAFDSTNWEII